MMKRNLLEVIRLAGRDHDGTNFIYHNGKGYMIWKSCTGGNFEETYLEVDSLMRGQGFAQTMFKEFCQRVKDSPPYHSMFAFVLTSNKSVRSMYQKMGFKEVDCGQSVYRDDGTTLVWIPFQELCKNLGVT